MTAGTLLVAHPRIDPGTPWSRAVVLITEHTELSTAGVVLNKPTSYSLREILESKGLGCQEDRIVFAGGPVNTSALMVLHSDDWYSTNTMQICRGAAVSSDNLMMHKIAEGNTPLNYRVICGLAGWQPGQLAQEIERNQWLTVPSTPSIIYDYDGEKQWHKAVELCSQQMMNQYF